MSGESDVQKTLRCLQKGALDFLDKPISLPRLLTSVKNALNIYNVKNSAQKRNNILFKSVKMKDVIERIKKLAVLNETILIYGESGTGKELVADNLHLFSNRYSMPIYKVNCNSLNSNLVESELFGHVKGSFTGADYNKIGYFEKADNSTLFIDEIGDFDLNLQSKILRALQEKKITPVGSTKEVEIDTRLVFATHRDIEKMVKESSFRQDLYFRLSTFVIIIPPLRDRLEDIDELAPHYLNSFLSENNLSYKYFGENAIEKLKDYSYPGNVRELIKIIKNAAFFTEGEIITPDNIEFGNTNEKYDIWSITKDMSLSESKSKFEKELIEKRLKEFDNDIQKTADSLNLIKNNLYRKLKQYGIDYHD
ncbi:sigma-54-dependent transcriptional regulator [Bacteroidota bacterium]